MAFGTFSRFTALAFTLACLALSAETVTAQIPTQTQQRCVMAINTDAAKIARAHSGDIVRCIRDAARGTLGDKSLRECLEADDSKKVGPAVEKLLENDAEHCADSPPFGYNGASIAKQAAIGEGVRLLEDLFGTPLGEAVGNDSGVRCQAKVTAAYGKLQQAELDVFRRCKKSGLKNSTVYSPASLDLCVDEITTDRKGRIAKARAKLGKALAGSHCSALAAQRAPSTMFAGDCSTVAGDADDLNTCIDALVQCRVCRLINLVDGLSRDCDAFDDNVLNGSCDSTEPTCDDGYIDQDETDIDCGGSVCPVCSPDRRCSLDADCSSGVCTVGVCQTPTCIDGVLNQNETEPDCGGLCSGCPDGAFCAQGSDCQSLVCTENTCLAATCFDGVTNGGESDLDCGGDCVVCPVGASCNGPSDCLSDICTDNICVGLTPQVTITTPTHGSFSNDATVQVTGTVNTAAADSSLAVNGQPVSIGPLPTLAWSTTVALTEVLNPIEVVFSADGEEDRERIVVVGGDSVLDGELSADSVGMRFNESGFDRIEAMVNGLVGLDLGTLIPKGQHVGDAAGYSIFIGSPAPSYSDPMGLEIETRPGEVDVKIQIHGLHANLFMDHPPTIFDCWAIINTNGPMELQASFTLEPLASDPAFVDVTQVGDVSFGDTDFALDITAGICVLAELFGLIPDINGTVKGAFGGVLNTVDANGNTLIASAIEDALSGIAIAGAVGAGLGLELTAPLSAVDEDDEGLTLGADSSFVARDGTGPGQCQIVPGAPDFAASYHVDEAFPSFGPLTPSGEPYGLGLAISSSAFSQLLKATTECGLLRGDLTEIDLGQGPLAVTPQLLAGLVPQFQQLEPSTPLTIQIRPTLAPIVTGEPGPSGELTELLLGQLRIDIVGDQGFGAGTELFLGMTIDAAVGLDLALVDGALAPTIGAPDPSNVDAFVVENPLGAQTAAIEQLFPLLFAPLVPSLADAFTQFPLPEFFGFLLDPVEVGRAGSFVGLYTNLIEAPSGGTVITHDAFTVNNGVAPADYGDNVSVSGGNYTVFTKDGVTGTPDITMSLAATGNGKKQTWANWDGRGAVLQLEDKNAIDSQDFTVTPEPGWAVKISSFVLDKWVGGGTQFQVKWWVLGEASGTLASGTWNLNRTGGRFRISPGGAVGYLGETLTLRFRHVLGDGSFLAIDDLHFEQTMDSVPPPPPSGTVITHDAFTTNNGAPPADYGDNVDTDGGNYIAYTNNGITGTPNIAMSFVSTGNAKKQTWANWDGRGAVLQLEDKDLVDSNDIVFTPDADWAVKINSFDLDKFVGGGTPFSVAWSIFSEARGVLAEGTWGLENGGGRETLRPAAVIGHLGEELTLRFRHNFGDGSFLAIDNIHFEQTADADPPRPPAGTLITHDAFTVENGAPPANYGDNISASGGNYVAYTHDGVTGTPNIAMRFASTGNAKKQTWPNWEGRGAVLQLEDKEAVDSNEIIFTPEPGWAVKISSFDLDKFVEGGDPFQVQWWIRGASSGTLASGTWNFNRGGGREKIFPEGALGRLGEEVTLRFRHVLGDGSFLAIDNIHFEQTKDADPPLPPGGTLITHSAFTVDNGAPPANYGDNVSVGGGNYVVFTKNSITGTPNISMSLAASGSAKKQTWSNWEGRGAVLQLEDKEAIDNNDFIFTPDPGWAVQINAFDLDKYVGGGNPFQVQWWILGADNRTLASNTWNFNAGGGRETIRPEGGLGYIGEPLRLRFRHNLGNGSYLAMDNLHFEQTMDADPLPEPE